MHFLTEQIHVHVRVELKLVVVQFSCSFVHFDCPFSSSFVPFSSDVESLFDRRVVFFSYGSGFASSMFSARFSGASSDKSALQRVFNRVQSLKGRLEGRTRVSPIEFTRILALKEKIHNAGMFMQSTVQAK